jgi:hypothetical protein
MKYNAVLGEWLATLGKAVVAGRLVKVVCSKPGPLAGDLKSVDVRPIIVKRALKLSFTFHHKTRDVVKNYSPEESEGVLARLVSESFMAARIFTMDADWLLLRREKQFSALKEAATQTAAPNLTHDRPKQRLIESGGKAYLQALGLTDASGQVLKSAQDKFRQINKYIEIVDGLVKALPQKSLKIADMGSGKGYLTFALYDHLVNTLGRTVEMVGVEFRPELVMLCNDIATAAGFKGLRFVQGTIADYDCAGVDVVIALHACDTATDDALAKAIKAGAGLVVVAPCCHKQVRREMGKAEGLEFMLQYGTYMERMAEMVTDGLRAKLLELSGYETNLFEFISDAHTPKNVMIVGTRKGPLKENERARIEGEIAGAKARFGIAALALEKMLGGR